MNPNEIETHLRKISDSIQRQNLSQTQIQTLVASLQQQLLNTKTENDLTERKLKGEIESLSGQITAIAQSASPVVKDLDDIAGVRTPKWYDVNVDFTKGDTANKFSSIEIAPDGPFIITQVTPLWEITDTDAGNFQGSGTVAPTGRVLPPTAFPFLVNELGRSVTAPYLKDLFDPTLGVDGALSDIPEFSIQIEVAGSGRYWTNQPVSTAAMYGYFGQPLFLGVQGWVERTDRIVIHATPNVEVPHNGRLKLSFHGYQILGHVNISEALGY